MQLQGDVEQLLRAGRNRRHHRRDAEQAATAASVDESSVLSGLLLKVTDKRTHELDQGLLRRIKALCKQSDDHIRAVHEYLLHALEANHAQVRYHAMDICDQLFQRSHLFRCLVTQHLPHILEHAVGTKASRPLPGPPNVATKLHEKALESIDQWADKYGAYYQQLRVSMRYLRDVLQMRFPQLRARAAAAEAEAQAREARAQEILREKLTVIVETLDETSAEIHSTLDQMAEAFELLMANPEQAQRGARTEPAGDEEGLEWEDVGAAVGAEGNEADEQELSEGLSEYRDTAVPEGLLGSASVVQNPDAVVLGTLRELNQLLGGSHMRTVNEWLRILTQVSTGQSGSNEDRQREQLLRRVTKLRGAITRAQDRYGAVMDALGPPGDTSAVPPPAQQDAAGPSATAQKDPKEAMPPWLAHGRSRMKDLFGSSSSDDEQDPIDDGHRANPGTPGQADAHAAGDTQAPTAQKAKKEAHLSGQASKSGEAKQTLHGAKAAAGPAAIAPRAAPQHGKNKRSEIAKAALDASKAAVHAGEVPLQRKQRIDYSAVAERLKRRTSGAAAVEQRKSPGTTATPAKAGPSALAPDRAVKTQVVENAESTAGCVSRESTPSKAVQPISVRQEGQGRDNWEPVKEEGLTPRLGNSPKGLWDSQGEGDNTPRLSSRQSSLWEGIVLDDDDSLASPNDSSPASKRIEQQGRTVARGPGERGMKRKGVSQAASSAMPEAKKSKIPESLKKALAAQAPIVPSGPHLAYWDSRDEALVNARGMQVYNHWGPVDEHKTLPAERLNELFGSMATYYRPPTEEELNAAAKRRAEQEKPSFKDEPLETQRVKPVKALVTPIPSPGVARLAAASAPTPVSAGGQHVPGLKGMSSASEQAAAAESAGETLQRAGHQWPSHISSRSAPETVQLGEESHAHPRSEVKGAEKEQQLDVEEVDWKPGDAGVIPASTAGAEVGSDSRPAEQAAGAPSSSRGTGGRDLEKPSKGQRALDKAHNDAVLAEAATRDPILANRWAAQQPSKAGKARKAQGAKRLGVRALLAKKLLSKRAVKSAAFDLSSHESEAHKELNTNRWEEK